MSTVYRVSIEKGDGHRLHSATHRDADRLFFLARDRSLERQPANQLLSRIELLLGGGVVRLERENLRHVLGVNGHLGPDNVGICDTRA